ncbi:ABC transporter ATP-binding protein [Ilumatobacter sp.]|uniref:ABC transporter ATP-binding protein n=1 Tax=Ilumatobacter sp. TaxID=1967498 RepID=UPI003B51AAFE
MRGPDGAIIEFDGAGKSFDDTWIVRDLTFEVERGSVLGLIGPSGSGKTSTVRLMNGAYRPDEGSVVVMGADPTTRDRRERRAIGYLPQQPLLFDDLSLWENLNFHASLNGVRFRRKDHLHEMLELVDLEGDERKLVRESSGGMQRRLALAATMAHDPSLLMLDEPTAGIDPILRRRFWDRFRELRDDGATLVISTQFVDEASYCDVVGLLSGGRLVALGAPDVLQREAYGGQLVDVEGTERLSGADLDRLRNAAPVIEVERTSPSSARLVVEPGTTVRDVVSSETPDVEVRNISEVSADWNDVFVRLLDRADDEGSSDEPELVTS